jgi:hypothetical protein
LCQKVIYLPNGHCNLAQKIDTNIYAAYATKDLILITACALAFLIFTSYTALKGIEIFGPLAMEDLYKSRKPEQQQLAQNPELSRAVGPVNYSTSS